MQAEQFAERLRREAGDDAGRAGRARVPRWRWPRARRESSGEQSVAFVASSADGLAEFCHALFNLNEFVYRQ